MSRTSIILLFFALFASLASSAVLVVPQVRLSGMDRIQEPKIAECLRSKYCPVTMDYRPSCGSDGRTYPNRSTVDCLNECLSSEEKVTIKSPGFCRDDITQNK